MEFIPPGSNEFDPTNGPWRANATRNDPKVPLTGEKILMFFAFLTLGYVVLAVYLLGMLGVGVYFARA